MRKWITTTVVAVLALALASVALAKFSQVANVTLTAHKGGQSTGINANLHSSDATAIGQKPKSAAELVITFPAGTKFNLRTGLRRTCTLSNKQLSNEFGPFCPSKSQIGTGTVGVNSMPITPPPNGRVKAYIAGANKIVLVITPTLGAYASKITVIRGTVSGATLTIPVPQLLIGPCGGRHQPKCSDPKTTFPGVTAVLVSLKLSVPALGSGRSALLTAGRCVSHKFVVKSHFVYRNHTKLDVKSSSTCR
jgi:hypothetical protein